MNAIMLMFLFLVGFFSSFQDTHIHCLLCM